MFKKLMVWLGYQKIPSMDITAVEPDHPNQTTKKLEEDDFSIDHLITYPSQACFDLMERILPTKPDQTTIGDNEQKEGNFEQKEDVYKNFVNFICENSDGVKIPLNKTINESFDSELSRRKIQSLKKQMVMDGMLIPVSPTTHVLNLSFDWDKYFML